jgi:pepF/M3 family oligoendopeptidase
MSDTDAERTVTSMTQGAAETNALPRWDLSNVYPGLDSGEFEEALAELRAELDRLDRYLDDNHVSRTAAPLPVDLAVVTAGYLDLMNAAQRLYATLRFYTWSFVTTDSYNDLAKRRNSEIEMLGARLEQDGMRFQGWLGVHRDALPAAVGADPVLKSHSFHLGEVAEQSRYLMTEPEESLASDLALSGRNAWSRLQATVVSQLSVPFERRGQPEQAPMTEILNLAYDPDPEVRRRAYTAEIAAWETVREPLAAALNGVAGTVVTLARRRGRTDPLHAALDQARIDRAILDAMMDTMEASFPVFRRYLRRKAERLGGEELPWWDLFAPTGDERRYTFGEARDLLLDQFFRFSPRLGALALRAFDEHWIDAAPRAGKVGGAFCMPLPAVGESRVLCNFDGSLNGVLTVAHELGHAFHNACLEGKAELQKVTPMTLAETASVFNETMVVNAALAASESAEERLSILEASLMNGSQIVLDISSRFRFDREVFERRARSELSSDELCEIMLRTQAETYGDGLDERYRHPYMWTWKAHYYRPDVSFYNFPYAFGLLFGLGLYKVYEDSGETFVPDYARMLASTGESTAEDLAARFGIDLRRSEFWQGSLAVLESQVQLYLAL